MKQPLDGLYPCSRCGADDHLGADLLCAPCKSERDYWQQREAEAYADELRDEWARTEAAS